MLLSLGFVEEDCAKCLRRLIRVIDGHGCAEAQTAWDDRSTKSPPQPRARPQTCPVQTTFSAGSPTTTRSYLRTCGFTEAQSEEIIADARADQPSTPTNQDLVITSFRQAALNDLLTRCPRQRARGRGDTAEEAVRARKTDAREASAGVVTPARTLARSDREHVVTPSIIPTPKALFPRSPKLSKELGNELATSCRDSQKLELMVSAGVVTPASTSARNDRGHVGTPSIIPTPQALFTGPPTHIKGLGNTYGAGEDDETASLGQRTNEEDTKGPPGV